MIDIQAIKSRYDVQTVCDALGLEGNRKGDRLWAINPTRDDRSVGSFYVDLKTGYFADKSTGDWGQDIVALWAYCRGMPSQGLAARDLDAAMAGKASPFPLAIVQRERKYGELVMPAIVHANMRMPTSLYPGSDLPPQWDREYVYSEVDGISVLGLVYRWNLPDGSKQIRQRFMFLADGGTHRWEWSGPSGNDNRPLYRLERLKPRPKLVWIVEGEKTCDAAQALAPDGVAVLSWLGGCGAAARVDVGHLRGIECVLIPDRDAKLGSDGVLLPYTRQPGVLAMNEIATKLQALGNRVSIVDYTPGDSESGWDLADASDEGWTPEQAQAMVRTNARPLPAVTTLPPESPGFGTKDLYSVLHLDTFTLAPNGAPLNCWQSYSAMLNSYGILCRDNQMTQRTELLHVKSQRKIMREEILSLCAYNRVPTANIREHLAVLASRCGYHPVVDWIKSRPWDGVSRMADMFGTIQVGDSDLALSARLFFRWCVSAVALATQERMDPTGACPAAQGVLVLVGSQDLNKSRWISSLAPAAFVRPGVILDVDDKDSRIKSTTAWLVEWSELTGSKNAAKIARGKAHITSSVDIDRPPYAAEATERPRRTVYIGTENHDDYLTDETGNRRWWTIRVRGLNVEHGIDTQQFWAEVYDAFRQGAPWWLVDDEKTLLAASNATHEQTCPIADLLYGGLRWDDVDRAWETAGSLLAQLGRRSDPSECKRALAYLRLRGCVVERNSGKGSRVLAPIPRVLR